MISERLKKLNIEIPNAPDPVGAYVAFKIIGNSDSKICLNSDCLIFTCSLTIDFL